MPTTIFQPTSPTNQNLPKMKISNFCVFFPIWMIFGMGANQGCRAVGGGNTSPTTKLYEFYHLPPTVRIFSHWLMHGMTLKVLKKQS